MLTLNAVIKEVVPVGKKKAVFAVTGNTYEYRDLFSDLGLKWNRDHKAWTAKSFELAQHAVVKAEEFCVEQNRAASEKARSDREAYNSPEAVAQRAAEAAELAERRRLETEESNRRFAEQQKIAEEKRSAEAAAAAERQAIITKAMELIDKPSVADRDTVDGIMNRYRREKFARASDLHEYRRIRSAHADYFNLRGYPLDLRGSGADAVPIPSVIAQKIIDRSAA